MFPLIRDLNHGDCHINSVMQNDPEFNIKQQKSTNFKLL